jgi:ribosomal protein S27E
MSEPAFIHGDPIALDDDPIDLRCERCGDEATVQDSKDTRSWCALHAPDILIEVSGGGAILTRKNEQVTVMIIDHDNGRSDSY